MSLSSLREKFQSLNMMYIVSSSIEATKDDLVEIQKSQMLHGLTADNKNIGVYKDAKYAARKAAQNPLAGYGNFDLKDKGEFQRNITVKFFSSSFIIFSTDYKNELLIEKCGPAIFGLSVPFTIEYSNLVLANEINRQIKNHINGV